jgi:hypothetical protein
MQSSAAPQTKDVPLADDILKGADAIAEFLFHGTSEHQRGRNRRKVYYLAETSKLPFFRLGALLCARKSVLLDFIAAQEIRVLPPREYRSWRMRERATGQEEFEQGSDSY